VIVESADDIDIEVSPMDDQNATSSTVNSSSSAEDTIGDITAAEAIRDEAFGKRVLEVIHEEEHDYESLLEHDVLTPIRESQREQFIRDFGGRGVFQTHPDTGYFELTEEGRFIIGVDDQTSETDQTSDEHQTDESSGRDEGVKEHNPGELLEQFSDLYAGKEDEYAESWRIAGETISLWAEEMEIKEIPTDPESMVSFGLFFQRFHKLARAFNEEFGDAPDSVSPFDSHRDEVVYGAMAASLFEEENDD